MIKYEDFKCISLYSSDRISNGITSCSLDHQSNSIVFGTAGNGSYFAYDIPLREEIFIHYSKSNSLIDIALEKSFYEEFVTLGNDKIIRVYKIRSPKGSCQKYECSSDIFCISYNYFGTLVCGGSRNGEIRLFDTREIVGTNTINTNQGEDVCCISWSPFNQNILYSADTQGNLIMIDYRNPKNIYTLNDSNDYSPLITSIDFNEEQRVLLSYNKAGEVIEWDYDTGSIKSKIKSPPQSQIIKKFGYCDDGYFIPKSNKIGLYGYDTDDNIEITVGSGSLNGVLYKDGCIVCYGNDNMLYIFKAEDENIIVDQSDLDY